MQNSGTKLVISLGALALLLGAVSWWYRYEAAHRASQFWGPEVSRLIAESEGFEAQAWGPASGPDAGESTDLSHARGQAHLRHALMSDRNYVWSELPNPEEITWHWGLRFYEGDREATVWLSEDLAVIGRSNSETEAIVAYSCQPMTASLEQYFQELGLVAKSETAASTGGE